MKSPTDSAGDLVQSWTFSSRARLGSSVRSKGLYLEIRTRLQKAAQKHLTVKAGELTLRMPADEARAFAAAIATIAKVIETVETRPVIPREIEDILAITSTERRRWLEDGRLPSAGTRTVALRGRARKITFHVFDPTVVADILDRDVVDAWREQDAEAAAEKRRQAAWTRKLNRADKPRTSTPSDGDDGRFDLRGWAEFERNGLLR